MRYELMVGLRYTRAKRRNRFISFISLISMAGIALGVAEAVPVEGERQVVLGVHVSAFRDAGGVGLPTWVWPDPVHRPVWDRTDVTAVCLEPPR